MAASWQLGALAGNVDADSEVGGRIVDIQKQLDWILDLLRDQAAEGRVLVVDVCDALAEHCRPSGGCSIRFAGVSGVEVLVNPVELIRAVRNLVDNAVRAAGDVGTVEVTVRRARGRVVLEVEDDGPGFGVLKPQTGHGLVCVRQFADRYGGTVKFGRSNLGGARVSLSVPLAPSQLSA
ncbi:MAG TPA: ATP-binding protein [Nocardioidaceae bacterium]|nr:ATP-binding protein [Nocardioidaceae bacterium]